MKPAAFAIPGDINTITGGYIYERRLLEGLRAQGRDVTHVQLAATFPDPDPGDMADAISALCAITPERALILDGLIYGSIDTAGLAQVKAPIIAMIHHPLAAETGLSPARQAHLFKTERDNLALAHHVLVPSPHTAEILTRDYAVPAAKITIARPGTDPRERRRAPTSPPLILSVGILHPRKGHDILLSALAQVQGLNWRAVIAGSNHDPAHAKALAQMVIDLGLSDRVQLAGQVVRDDLDRLFAEASIFALATHYEGYGMVFDEALSWGLPIVSCATGAVPQTVPPQAGLLVPPGDRDALAKALAQLLEDESQTAEMARNAAQAGQALPRWHDTAHIAGQVLDAT